MANLEHIKYLLKGKRYFNHWHKRHKEIIDLSNFNLSKLNLQDYDLRDCNFEGSIIKYSNLKRANLNRANLKGVDLSFSDLRDVEFSDISGNSAIISNAILIDTKFTDFNGNPGSGFLELASTFGLETAKFKSQSFLRDYISDAFQYAHIENLAEATFLPQFHSSVTKRIKLLEELYKSSTDLCESSNLIKFVENDLIKDIKLDPNIIWKISPRDFEKLIAELLSRRGFDISLTSMTRDGGYDLIGIEKNGLVNQKWLIECKKYKPERKIGISLVRNLYGARLLSEQNNFKLMLATTSSFTFGVESLASSRYDLELKQYNDIMNWINSEPV